MSVQPQGWFLIYCIVVVCSLGHIVNLISTGMKDARRMKEGFTENSGDKHRAEFVCCQRMLSVDASRVSAF